MKFISNIFIIAGVLFLAFFGYQFIQGELSQKKSLAQAEENITKGQDAPDTSTQYKDKDKATKAEKMSNEDSANKEIPEIMNGEAFATLEIPKLEKTLPVVEGTDPDSLDKGVGHLSNSVLPGDGEQILLSGHRDTVFRDFGEIEIGDRFTVNMPDGSYTYEIKETEIVSEDDTSVIRSMGEEVLVVTTCYPFHFIGNAPERFVTYAYPVE